MGTSSLGQGTAGFLRAGRSAAGFKLGPGLASLPPSFKLAETPRDKPQMAVNLKGPATQGVAGLESTLGRFPLRVAGGLGPTFGDNAANAGECPGASLRGRREVVRLLVYT